MDFKNPKFYLIVIITFVVVFLMNYLGNSNAPDQLERALMNGAAGAIGITIGLWIWNRNKNDDTHHNFD
ncbi:hypothetical protein [Riemerella anatipestifer]|uniref:Uncharacterized protein n=1 Tax=Riemerella anatipestifer TaxID=34085 RepID=A0AAP3EVX2_RIEAN|nr:hypothetical protein [Riemerella anatipestifer]AZZ58379.1 hypothetical protein AWB57_04630 [Riemerella anatipestifer]MBO4234003.1 hypothetical protein [Riemerella anatipestifer]MBT0551810.1 hypothetical protein [Riemerella anatipestifer]MBT0553995.1 hypothetical protein [Riemerella anatipestifer]MBT0572810.1 hypothetical protein [Riemerella anatipestifer]